MPPLKPTERLQSITGSILWLLTFQFFLAEQIARLAWKIPYSMATNVISDLGAMHCSYGPDAGLATLPNVCSPLHNLMNASLMLQGCLILGGALLVRRMFPDGWRFTAGLFLLAVGGLGATFVGVAPEDTDFQLHAESAAAFFYGSNLAMLLVGVALSGIHRGGKRSRRSILPLVCGSIGLLATLLLPYGGFLHIGLGIMERLAAYPLPVWLTWCGYSFLVRIRAMPAR